jgi:sugar lactone lactonase YvrE
MKIKLVLIVLLIGFRAFSQPDSAYFYFKQAKAAYKQGETALYYDLMMKATHFHPYHPTMLYEAAVASVMNNKNDEAVSYLKSVIMINAKADLEKEEFKALSGMKAFQEIKENQKQFLQPVITSDTAFIITDPTLHIECIAKGKEPDTFFFGSIHKKKIVMTDKNGKVSDFNSSASEGMTSVFGVKVDSKRNVLWACSSPMQEMEDFDTTARSAIFKYDLKSKKLLQKYTPNDKNEHIFGDLVLDPNGNAFVSDSRLNIIYKADHDTGKLSEFFTSKEFWNLQGITFDQEAKNLFIADYIRGIFKLNLATMKLVQLSQQFDISLKSIDGLAFYNNSLIAIQNYIYPMRVTQYFLDKNHESLKSYNIIDRGHPAFNEPTIGIVDGANFIYVANSLWSGYDDSRKIKPVDQLQPVVILKAALK